MFSAWCECAVKTKLTGDVGYCAFTFRVCAFFYLTLGTISQRSFSPFYKLTHGLSVGVYPLTRVRGCGVRRAWMVHALCSCAYTVKLSGGNSRKKSQPLDEFQKHSTHLANS